MRKLYDAFLNEKATPAGKPVAGAAGGKDSGAMKYVKQVHGKWALVSRKSGRPLKYFDEKPSQEQADKALRAVEFFKHESVDLPAKFGVAIDKLTEASLDHDIFWDIQDSKAGKKDAQRESPDRETRNAAERERRSAPDDPFRGKPARVNGKIVTERVSTRPVPEGLSDDSLDAQEKGDPWSDQNTRHDAANRRLLTSITILTKTDDRRRV